MATAEQMKSLIKAYVDRNDEKFKTVVLQIAAHEAKLGHDNLARELKMQIDKLGSKRASCATHVAESNVAVVCSKL